MLLSSTEKWQKLLVNLFFCNKLKIISKQRVNLLIARLEAWDESCVLKSFDFKMQDFFLQNWFNFTNFLFFFKKNWFNFTNFFSLNFQVNSWLTWLEEAESDEEDEDEDED